MFYDLNKKLLILTIAIFSACSLFADNEPVQDNERRQYLEAIKLVERVVEELPAHLKADSSPIIASLYNEYLTHFLGQNEAELDPRTVPAVLGMTGVVNRYFNGLIEDIRRNGVVISDQVDMNAVGSLETNMASLGLEVIEVDKRIKKLRDSGLKSADLYYVAVTTSGEIVAFAVPEKIGGTVKVGHEYVLIEKIIESYLGKKILRDRGYKVVDGGLMVVMRSDKFAPEGTDIDSYKRALEKQRTNKINSLRIRASKEVVNSITKKLGPKVLVIEVGSEDVVGLKEVRLDKIAPNVLKSDKWVPQRNNPIHLTKGDVFKLLENSGDQLLMYPYDSFEAVIDMITYGAKDPNVKSILITLYRTADGDEGKIIQALEDAIKNGKRVNAIIEARARGNELSNLEIMERLVNAAERYNAKDRVTITYQSGGMKVHAKLVIFERYDGKKYAYIPTGNLHEKTAGTYTDIGLFTADQSVIYDLVTFMDNINNEDMSPLFRSGKVFAAPWNLRVKLESLIKEQTALGSEGHIIIKANIMTDPNIISLLDSAKKAGVEVDAIIRERSLADEDLGVKSILGPFLEHMRIYQFGRGTEAKVYLSSGDPSVSKLDLRYELFIETTDPKVKKDLMDVLVANIIDDKGSWVQTSDGYKKIEPQDGVGSFGVQNYLKERSQTQLPIYKGVIGLTEILNDSALNGWELIAVYEKYPDLFSVKNISTFISSANIQPTKAESLNVLTQAMMLIEQLSDVAPELQSLKGLIASVEQGLSNTDLGLLKDRLYKLSGEDLSNVDPKVLLIKAVDYILSINGNLEGNDSELLSKLVFGSINRNFDEGLLSLLKKKGLVSSKIKLMKVLVVTNNNYINCEGQIFQAEVFFVNVFGEADIGKEIFADMENYLTKDFALLENVNINKVDLKIDRVTKILDRVNTGALIYR